MSPDADEAGNEYCRQNCKGFQETGLCFADGGCDAKRAADKVKNDDDQAARDYATVSLRNRIGIPPDEAFKAGIAYERERLMKGAVEIDTDITINRYTKQHILQLSSTDEHIQHLPKGEYKVIIIKKEK